MKINICGIILKNWISNGYGNYFRIPVNSSDYSLRDTYIAICRKPKQSFIYYVSFNGNLFFLKNYYSFKTFNNLSTASKDVDQFLLKFDKLKAFI